MTRILIALALAILLTGCDTEPPSHPFTPTIEQQQTIVIDQGW